MMAIFMYLKSAIKEDGEHCFLLLPQRKGIDLNYSKADFDEISGKYF